ncbi:hypothetical protein BB415_02470 [Helicobacter pylori]|uniref:hypothetical protein n=1 Tax=Helicobacter pylori TaxID=210 RepID=UPI000992ECFB|nr:hypothetical protein [Helicobacter pylori]OOP84334.1 hypothetical protein B0X24_04305 [Helicobacter pylori]PDX19172.1 hypothetical protein BB415_02470 [Helicobacter pylori]
MLLNYDFLELVDEPHNRSNSLTASIDKALADRKLARQNKPSVRVLGKAMPLSKFLDAVGDEISRLKYDMSHKTIKGSTIESSNLISIYKKIASGLPFGTISAFRPFKPVFEKDFTEKQQKALINAYKSGFDPKNADKVAQYWQNKPTKIDLHKPIKAKDFFKGNTNIYRTLRNLFGQKFMNSYIAPKSEATMKDFMSSDKFVKKYRYTQKDNMKRTRQLKSLLDSKRHFLGYIQVIGYWKDKLEDTLLPDKETSFFVFTNEPSITFDLASYLLLLARLFNQAAICYCDNAKTDKVELVSALPNDFGDVWAKFTDITFTIPLTQSLTRLHNKVYTFFEKKNMENYGVSFEELSTTKLKAMGMPKDIEGFNIPCKSYIEHHIKTSIYSSLGGERNYPGRTFDMDKIQQYELQAIKRLDLQRCSKSKSFKASYNHNIKVNNLVNAMLKGKKVSRTLIAKVLANTIDTDAGYCFISPTDLATQLANISPRLSKSIVTAIEQAEGVRLNYALIDKVTYNSLHNILSFIFDIDNPLSDQAFERLVIEVPREALKNVKLPQIKNVLTAQIFEGAYHFRGNDYQFKG